MTLRSQTILVVSAILVLFYIISIGLYVFLSTATVTLEREAQIADRIATTTRLIEKAAGEERMQLARHLSGPRFKVSIDEDAIDQQDEAVSGSEITQLISRRFTPLEHIVAADYVEPVMSRAAREISAQRTSGPFRIHETLIVSIDLPDGAWLNFEVSGSAWDHMIPPMTIASLTLMTFGFILLAAWAVSRPLRTLSALAQASDEMAADVPGARPLDETGPLEINRTARAFNRMQSRVQTLLSARDEMLGAISHDFRTPLTRLRLRVERIEDAAQRTKAIGDIDEMESLIQFTLDFARDNASKNRQEETDMVALVHQVVSLMEETGTCIKVDLPPTLPINGQPVELRRVITNLIVNGLFYGSHVGISGYMSDRGVVLDIDDNGPGIPIENREGVFTPFVRLESSRSRETGGTGLGLSIAQTIIHAHGGTIDLLDSEMGGLKARVQLPLIVEEHE